MAVEFPPAQFEQKRRRLNTSNAAKNAAVETNTPFRESFAATASRYSEQDEGLQELNQNGQLKSWFRNFCFHAVKLVVCLAFGLGFLLYLPPEAETDRTHRHDWGVGVNEISASIEAGVRDNLYPNRLNCRLEKKNWKLRFNTPLMRSSMGTLTTCLKSTVQILRRLL